MFFAVMVAPLEYVRPELFDEAVDRHHYSYVSAVLGGPLGMIHCRTTRTLLLIHPRPIHQTANTAVSYDTANILH
jgi:hypothetical protein